MNYKQHYDLLIEQQQDRLVKGYTERHHIIPRCMGGTDDADNIAILTPEEHYVAHQLLVKIYPGNGKLIYAMNMMTVGGEGHQRSMNKRYGWVKRKYISECRKRIGPQNSSYGKGWYYNPITYENIKCLPENIPAGFVKGRKYRSNEKYCLVCNIQTHSPTANYCDEHRNEHSAKMRRASCKFIGREKEFLSYIDSGVKFDAAVKMLGYKNYVLKFGVGNWARALIDTRKN